MACTIVRDLDHDGMPLSSKNDDEPLVYHNLEVVPPYNLPRLASDVGSSLASSLSLHDSTIFDEDSVLRPNAVLEHARLNLSAQVTLKEQPPAIDWNLSFHNQITKTMSSSPLTTWSAGSSDIVKLTSVHSRDLASSFETVAPPEPPSPISGLKPWSFNVHFCGPPCIAKDQNGFLGAAVCDFPDFTFVQSIKHGKPIIRNEKAAVKMNNQNKVPSQTPSAPKSKSLLIKKPTVGGMQANAAAKIAKKDTKPTVLPRKVRPKMYLKIQPATSTTPLMTHYAQIVPTEDGPRVIEGPRATVMKVYDPSIHCGVVDKHEDGTSSEPCKSNLRCAKRGHTLAAKQMVKRPSDYEVLKTRQKSGRDKNHNKMICIRPHLMSYATSTEEDEDEDDQEVTILDSPKPVPTKKAASKSKNVIKTNQPFGSGGSGIKKAKEAAADASDISKKRPSTRAAAAAAAAVEDATLAADDSHPTAYPKRFKWQYHR